MNLPRRRVWLPVGLALVVVAAGVVVAVQRVRQDRCGSGDTVVAGRSVVSPLSRTLGNDQRLRRLAAAVGRMPAPFGPVLGGLGYDYDQYLTLAGLDGTLAAWTKRNAVAALLDEGSLAPRWGLRDTADPHAWDASDRFFYDISLRRGETPEVSALDLATGHRRWCARLPVGTLGRDDPLATEALPDGGLAGVAGRTGRLETFRVGSRGVVWSHRVRTVDHGDFFGTVGGAFVVGGRPMYELADATSLGRAPAGPVLAGLDPRDGRQWWSVREPANTALHVLGGTGSRVVALQRGSGGDRLVAIDAGHGTRVWERPLTARTVDATLRDTTVLVRTPTTLTAYDARTGRPLWRDPVPQRPQFFPYGFAIDQQPMLDAGHLLLGTTGALVSLDLHSGRQRRYPLPTDGINTTYWPYQVVVTGRLVAVVTNTGAVVARREG